MELKTKILTGAVLGAVLLLGGFCTFGGGPKTDKIGNVSTALNSWGFTKSDQITVEAFDDPEVPGVACFVARAVTGGIKGSLGVAEDPSDASIACRQIGPIDIAKASKVTNGERVFQERSSILFKTVSVVRYWDPKRKTLVYLSYSDKLIDGSPKNSISAVAIQKWD